MSWLDSFFIGVNTIETGGAPVTQRPIMNFVTGANVVDNPNFNRTDVTVVSSTVPYGGTISTAALTTLTVGTRTGFDTTSHVVSMRMPLVGVPGAIGMLVGAFHAGGDVELANGATLVDTLNSYQIQNPIDRSLNTTITWGPGSGGSPNPNLPDGSSVDWVLATNAAGAYFWQVVATSC